MAERARLVDDIMRVASGAFGTAVGLRDEVEAQMRQRIERLVSRTELVGRDEFEVVKALAEKALAENDRLSERVAALEKSQATSRKNTKAESKSKAAPSTSKARKSASGRSAGSRKPATKGGGRSRPQNPT